MELRWVFSHVTLPAHIRAGPQRHQQQSDQSRKHFQISLFTNCSFERERERLGMFQLEGFYSTEVLSVHTLIPPTSSDRYGDITCIGTIFLPCNRRVQIPRFNVPIES